MSDARESKSDMGVVVKPTIDSTWREVRRLSKDKANKQWVESEFREQKLKDEFRDREVKSLGKEVKKMSGTLTEVGSKASEALRIANETKESVEKGHSCIHEHTFSDLETTVAETSRMMKDFTKMKGRHTLAQWIGYATFVIVVAGTIIAWRVDQELLKNEMGEVKASDKKQGEALIRIEHKLDNSSTSVDAEKMAKALKKVLEEHEIEKKEEEPKRGRRRTQ